MNEKLEKASKEYNEIWRSEMARTKCIWWQEYSYFVAHPGNYHCLGKKTDKKEHGPRCPDFDICPYASVLKLLEKAYKVEPDDYGKYVSADEYCRGEKGTGWYKVEFWVMR